MVDCLEDVLSLPTQKLLIVLIKLYFLVYNSAIKMSQGT